MRWLFWKHETRAGVEQARDAAAQAKQLDADAGRRLDAAKQRTVKAKETARWVHHTLVVNSLTDRFLDTLRHGGST